MKILIVTLVLTFINQAFACPEINQKFNCKSSENNNNSSTLQIRSLIQDNKTLNYTFIQDNQFENNYIISNSWEQSTKSSIPILYFGTCDENKIEINFIRPYKKNTKQFSTEKMLIHPQDNILLITTTSKNYNENDIFFSSHFLTCSPLN